jgi:hypothetical protein
MKGMSARFAKRVQGVSPLNEKAIAFLAPKAAEYGLTLVPEGERAAVTQRVWEGSGRQGALKTYKRLLQGGYLGISRAFVEEWAKHNETLQVTTAGERVVSNPTRASGCWEIAAADLFFLPKAKNAVGCLLMVDAFSGFICTQPLRDKSAKSVATAFSRMFAAGHVPATLRIDGGPEFQGECMQLLLQYRVQVRISISSHANTAHAERSNLTMKRLLTRARVAKGTPWPDALAAATLGYNTTVGPRGHSPHDILFRRVPGLVAQMDAAKAPEPTVLEPTAEFEPVTDPYDDHASRDVVVKEVQDAMRKSADAMVRRSAGRLEPVKVGDMVRVKLAALSAVERRKQEGALAKSSLGVFWTATTHRVTAEEPGRVEGMQVYKVDGYSGAFKRADLLLA